MNDFKLYFILFIIYSFLGWIIETIICSITKGEPVSRGFLIGPICTIYGCSAILMIIFLSKYIESPMILFVMGVFICSTLEYLTSVIMEKLFNTRWWDYSHKKFNINGRICLRNSFFFGVLGLALLYGINPFLLNLLSMIPSTVLNISFYVLFILLIIDFVISFITIYRFTKTAKLVKKDSCDKINKKVKEEIEKGKDILKKRLIHAFPNFNIIFKNKKQY